MTKHQPWKMKHRNGNGLDHIRTLANTRWHTQVSKEYQSGETGGGAEINKGQIASPWSTVPDYSRYQAMAALAGSS